MTAGGEAAVRWWRGRLEIGCRTEINTFGRTGFGVIGFEMELVGKESGRIGHAKMCLRGVVICI